MCIPGLMAAIGAGAGAATASGATALATIGAGISAVGSIAQGIMGARAAREQAAAIEQQRQTEAVLTATRDQRERREFRSAIAKQRAELVGRGVNLDSPTAVLLGQTAAREMSFQSQATRAGGQARSQELSAQARAARARGVQSLLRGGLGAADTVLTAAPDIWPGLRG
jgi:hypothetical protein